MTTPLNIRLRAPRFAFFLGKHLIGWSEKHKSWKMQKVGVESEPRHSTDFRTIFEIMIGLFVLRNVEQTCFTESGGSFGTPEHPDFMSLS